MAITLRGLALLFAVVTLAAPDAQATLIDFGTGEAVTFRDCIAGQTRCDDVVSPPELTVYGGTPGADSSTANATLPGYGMASGSVSLSGTIGAPILAASATSTPDTRENTNSVALQSYTYTGTETTTRTFGGTLTYSQTVTGDYPADSGVHAAINVFKLSVPMVDVGSTPESNFSILFGPQNFPGYVDLGVDLYDDASSSANGTALLGVTVTLNPDDVVWVWAILQTPALNGGVIDASHTFVTGWDNTADLTPAIISAVPEPTTLALVALALSALGVLCRRKRQEKTGARPVS